MLGPKLLILLINGFGYMKYLTERYILQMIIRFHAIMVFIYFLSQIISKVLFIGCIIRMHFINQKLISFSWNIFPCQYN